MYLKDGEPISPDVAFEHEDVVYPPGWIYSATPEELAGVGITEVPNPAPVDHRFWYEEGMPRPVEDVQAMYIVEIKARCQHEILLKYPIWHQSNVTSRGVELTYTGMARSLTPEETVEAEGFQTVWDDIKSMRAHSDALEAEVMTLTFDELLTWQQHGWPEPPPGVVT